MCTLALDIGEVRVGLAVSDSAGKIATPLKVLLPMWCSTTALNSVTSLRIGKSNSW